jgi:hypothetical protein
VINLTTGVRKNAASISGKVTLFGNEILGLLNLSGFNRFENSASIVI